jgi:hypothetical protein
MDSTESKEAMHDQVIRNRRVQEQSHKRIARGGKRYELRTRPGDVVLEQSSGYLRQKTWTLWAQKCET